VTDTCHHLFAMHGALWAASIGARSAAALGDTPDAVSAAASAAMSASVTSYFADVPAAVTSETQAAT